MEIQVQQYLNSTNKAPFSGTFKIPVVVHLVGSDINDDYFASNYIEISNQIKLLNECFRKEPGSHGDGTGVDTQIEFCLATVDPDGYPTDGITHTYDVNGSPFEIDPDNTNAPIQARDGYLKQLIHWPHQNYLNLYVVNLVPGLNGYSYRPNILNTGYAYLDGVVIDPDVFGGSLTNAKRDLGVTCVHEVGHWLDLMHPWGPTKNKVDCSWDDGVDDTPICDGPYWSEFPLGCPSNAECSVENSAIWSTDIRQVENYMDYSDDDCRNKFTQGQKDRMILTGGTFLHC